MLGVYRDACDADASGCRLAYASEPGVSAVAGALGVGFVAGFVLAVLVFAL